jgi:HEAT repeat protein
MDDQTSVLKLFEDLHSHDWTRRERARERLRRLGAEAVLIIDQLLQNSEAVSDRAQMLEVLALIGSESRAACPTVAQDLSSPHPALRRRALEVLERAAPENSSLLPKLLDLLHDEDASVRLSAARALASWRVGAKQVVPALVHTLLDDDSGVRYAAARALRAYAPQSVTALLRYFDDTAVKLQTQVAWALGRMGDEGREAIPELALALEARSARLRKAAGLALGKMGLSACPALIQTMKRGSSHGREEAAKALAVMARNLGPNPGLEGCIPALLTMLEKPRHRGTAARTLESFGSIAVAALIDLFQKDDELLQELALDSLERMRSQALPALPQLIAGLSSANGRFYERLSETLGALGGAAVDPLLEALDSADIKVCQGAVKAFAAMAKQGPWRPSLFERVLPKLINALGHPGMRESVARTLSSMGKEAVPFLLDVIRSGDLTRSRYALWALARIGPKAKSATGLVIDLLQSPEPALHSLALTTLVNIGPAAVPALLDCLEDPATENLGTRALKRIGALAVPQLLAALDSKESRRHPAVVRALAAIVREDVDVQGDAIFAALRRCLCATDAQLRQAAVEAAVTLGENREQLIPHLLPLLKDEDELVRRRTIDVLVSMGLAAVAPLVATLAGDEVDVRREAAEALAKMGEEAVAGLCQALRSETPEVRREAARTLGRIGRYGGSASSAVSALVESLEDDAIKCAAAFALGEICCHLEMTVPALVGLLADSDREARWWAAHALGSVARESSRQGSNIIVHDAVFELAGLLSDEHEDVSEKAAWALTGLGQGARLAVPELLSAALAGLGESYLALRATGAGDREQLHQVAQFYQSRSLLLKRLEEKLGLDQGLREDPEVMSKLKKGLEAEDIVIRCMAARGVGLLGLEGRSLGPDLVLLLKGSQPLLVSGAAWALEQLGRSAIPDLLPLIEQDSEDVAARAWALLSLQRMARADRLRKGTVPASRQAAAVLVSLLDKNTDSLLSQLALRVIGVLGVEQTTLLPMVTAALADDRLQRSAIRALEELGTSASAALFESLATPELRRGALRSLIGILSRVGLSKLLDKALEALKNPNAAVRKSAVSLLEKAVKNGISGTDTQVLMPKMVAALKDVDVSNRAVAAKILAALGLNSDLEQCSSLLPALQQALSDGASEVRQSASHTLVELSPAHHSALLELAQRPEDADTVVRQQSAWALGEIQDRGSESEALKAQASLLTLIKDPSPAVRQAAVRSLSNVEGSAMLASALSQTLKDQDFGVRWETVWAFWMSGSESVPELIDSLDDPKESDRSIAVLGEIGRVAVPELVEALQHDELWQSVLEALTLIGAGAVSELVMSLARESLRERASIVLGRIGLAAVPALIHALKDPLVRQIAAESLGRIGAAAIPQLIEALRDDAVGIRLGAARALGRLGPVVTGSDCDDCVIALCDALSDKHGRVRSMASRALGRMGPKIRLPKVVKDLSRSLLKNPNPIREESARALGFICQFDDKSGVSQEAAMALPGLLEAIRADHGGVRTAATGALGRLGPVAIEALSGLLNNERVAVRMAGIEALETIGRSLPESQEWESSILDIVDALLITLKDSEARVCHLAAEALGRLEGGLTRALRQLEELIKSGDGRQRKALLHAFQKLEGRSERGLTILILALADQDPELRALAAKLLGSFGDKAVEALEGLQRGLGDGSVAVRVHCAEALGALGEKAERGRPRLLDSLNDEHAGVRAAACLALAKLGSSRANTLPSLLAERLEDPEAVVRAAAAQALGVLGPPAMAVSAAVIKALNDPSDHVCMAACHALGQIDLSAVVSPGAIAELLEDPGNAREVKEEALRALTLIVRDAAPEHRLPLIPRLSRGFEQSFDGCLRRNYVMALGSCAPFSDRRQCERVLELITQWPLEELDRRSQTVFVKTIERIGLASPAVANALLEAFKSGIDVLELRAAAAFGRLEYQDPIDVERILEALQAGLSRRSAGLREAVIESLSVLALKFDREELLREFIAALDDPAVAVRHAAVRALRHYGMASEDVLEALIPALRALDLGLRLTAINALASLGRGAPMVLAPLVATLDDASDDVREAAASSLLQIGREMRASVPVFEAELRSLDVCKRRLITSIIGDLGAHSTLVVRALKRALADEDIEVQTLAVKALANLGSCAYEAIPDLMGRLETAVGPLRLLIINAFASIGSVGGEAVPVLLKVMKHEQKSVIATLSAMGTAANRAIPAFIELLADEKFKLRKELDLALDRFGKPDVEDLPAFILLLGHEAAVIRRRTLEIIATLGFIPTALLPTLLSLLEDSDELVLALVHRLLNRRLSMSKEQVSVVVDLLDSENPDLLQKSMECLSELGADAEEAVPAIMKIFASGREQLRLIAVRSLGDIGVQVEGAAEMLEGARDGANEALAASIDQTLESIKGRSIDKA